MTLQKVIDALIKIQNNKDPKSALLKARIHKVDIHYFDDIIVTLGNEEVGKECVNCNHFSYCQQGKPVVCELFNSTLKELEIEKEE